MLSKQNFAKDIKKVKKDIKLVFSIHITLGIKVRNMKMDLNIYGTWRRVTFEKLMMKNCDFLIWLCRLVTPYNIV